MTFDEFVGTKLRNAWVKEPGMLNLYVRRSLPITGTDFDLANVNCEHPGCGALTRFLDKYEPRHTFFVENVLSERLRDYLIRRRYTCVSAGFGFGNYAMILGRW